MLTIHLKKHELFDNINQTFSYSEPRVVNLEHSLISVSKWESKWHKPYLPSAVNPGITGPIEQRDYISCMLIGKYPAIVPTLLLQHHKQEIRDYISNPHTATTIRSITDQPSVSRKIITTELIYYWMIRFGIPHEYERWHLNRLLMLISVCNEKEKEADPKKRGGGVNNLDAAASRHALNKMRKASL